jgi:hypothetical protein
LHDQQDYGASFYDEDALRIEEAISLLRGSAPGEVSEAEVEAALAAYYASFQCGKESGVYYDEQTRKAGMRAALEAAARVRGK